MASSGVVLALLLAGCSSSSKSTSAQFMASTTAPNPGVVKLVEKARSGARVVVDVVLFGPGPGLDLTAFRFGIRIGDPSLVRFVPQLSYTQNALIADAGQAIAIGVDGESDPSLVQLDIAKVGGGAGNGIAGTSAVVIELAFDVQRAGTSTLTLVGVGNTPPEAVDSARAPIAGVIFDAANASVIGVTTGGGGY
jgi:hypothetical protein